MKSKKESACGGMIRIVIAVAISGWVMVLAMVPAIVSAQDAFSSEDSIKNEIIARYRSFEGAAEDQTWEKWQDYFLNSPNIGNMHGNNLEIGWETYREGSQQYYQRPVARRAAIRFDDLKVFVVDERTAWVTGTFVNIIGEQEVRPMFYDMLTKTPEGWQVFFSYVAPPE
jgi:hypothetical protein